MQQDLAVGIMGFLFVILVIIIVAVIFYLLTLHKALSRVSPRNRLMEPGLVWLSLIPIFNIVWSFFIATRVPGSLQNEFRDRGQDDGSDYGKGIGLAQAILGAVSIPFNVLSGLSRSAGVILLPLGLAFLVLLIMFWVRIAGYSNQLAVPFRDYDDDYDRPRERRRRAYADEQDNDREREGIPWRGEEADRFREESSPVRSAPPPPPVSEPYSGEAQIVECPGCQKSLKVPPEVMGKMVKCPVCGVEFIAGQR